MCIGILSANSANAQVTVSDPVIDDTTHGDCFFLIPDPERLRFEEHVGPDLYSVAPGQYIHNCFGGLLFDNGTIDFRIFRGLIPASTNAFAWTQDGLPDDENEVARQWNPCRNTFKGATWDDGDPANPVIQPMVVELEIDIGGSIQLAYYFVPGGYRRSTCMPYTRL